MDEQDADMKGIAVGMRRAFCALPEPNSDLEELLARIREADRSAGQDQTHHRDAR